jgi:hypothetical protein
LVGGSRPKHEAWRLPTPEIERVVATATAKLLDNRATIVAALESIHLDASMTEKVLKSVQAFTSRLHTDSERAPALALLVDRVDLRPDNIRLTLSLMALMPQGGPVQADTKGFTVTKILPMRLMRRGIGTKLIIDGVKYGASRDVHAAFLHLVARSQGWFEALITGQAQSIATLAKQAGLSERYVSSLLPLAFLAPSIIEAAAENRLPANFPLAAMTNRPDIPIRWQDQIRAFDGQ